MRRDLLALGFFALGAVVLLYRMVLNLDRFAPDPGDPLLNSWIMAWDVHALTANLKHFFDANIFFPYPLTLAYSESLLGDLPIAGPLIALTGNPLLAYNVVVLASFILGGWCMYFAVSRMTGSGWAGLIAGTVYAYQLERFAAFSHVQLLTTQWLPLVVYFTDRVLREQRWRYWLGLVVFFNLQFLNGYNVGLFMALMFGLLVVGYLVVGLGRITPRLLAQAGAGMAVTMAVSIPPATPYFTLARRMAMERTLADLSGLSGSPRDYLTADPVHWLYGGLGRLFTGGQTPGGEHFLFLGVVAWVLVLLALLWRAGAREQRRPLLVMAAVMAVLILLSWGPKLGGVPLPYALVFEHVPGFKGIRVPARLITVVSVLVALIGGYGVRPLLDRLGQRRRYAAPAICLLIMAEAGFMQWQGYIVPPPSQGPEVCRWLASQPGDPVVLELPILTNATLQAYTQSTRQYYSTCHWKRMVNGYSGFLTQAYLSIGAVSQEFPNEATCQWLEGLRVDLLILHRDDYEAARYEEIEAGLPAWAGRLQPMQDFGDARVLQVVLPRWNAGAARPEFGGKLRLLGYAPPSPGSGPLVLRLYWQVLATMADCEVALHPERGTPMTVALAAAGGGPAQWHIGEVDVQEVRLPREARQWTAVALTVCDKAGGASLGISANGQTLAAVRLESMNR